MLAKIVSVVVAVFSAALGILMVAFVWSFSEESDESGPMSVTTSAPRPGFALDTPEITGTGRFAAGHALGKVVRSESELAYMIAETAGKFGVPVVVLEHLVLTHARQDADTDIWSLGSMAGHALESLNDPKDIPAREVLAVMVAHLERDPRPLDSHATRQPELGMAVRATHLLLLHERIRRRIVAEDMSPEDDTLWYLALVQSLTGSDELECLIVEAAVSGAKRRRGAMEGVSATWEIFGNKRFVDRAFLREWNRKDALRRQRAFEKAAREAAVVMEIVERKTED